MSEKKWKNRWVCNPRFLNLEPRQMLHRQLDTEFQLEEHREELKNNHTLFRKSLVIEPGIKEVILDISADDYYKLYINGKYVTQGPANSYPFCYNYNRIDITKDVQIGENILAVHVYYQGLVNRAYNSGDYRQGMIAEVWVDGRLVTDECWKYAEAAEYGASRTIAYDTQFDEIIDNRVKLSGWKEQGYDDSAWETAAVVRDDHVLVLQQTPNLQMEYRYPVHIEKQQSGYLLDFGEELTGTFYMKTWGHAGDEVTILFGEELESEHRVRNAMRCNCLYEDKLILEEGENELEQFEYKCFRYVQLITEQEVKMEAFRVDYRHYPFDEDYCKFRSEDELVNQIWNLCKNAVRNCSQEAFLDCPHREKGQYLGDLTVTAHALYYLTGDTALFKKALTDFANSTRICEGMMAVAPGNFMQEIADFSLLYPYQLLLYYRLACEAHGAGGENVRKESEGAEYREKKMLLYEEASEEKVFLKKMLPVAEGIARYFEQFQNESGMLENVKTKWNLVDWPENLRDNYDFDLPQPVVGDGCHNVINALYVGMRICIEEIKEILEISYDSEAEVLKAAFVRSFYKPDTGLFADSTVSSHSSLHANVFACFYGLEPEGNKIAELIREKGLCCGVFTAYFVLYGLIRMGKKEQAYELIVNQSEHSWYNMLKEGATTAYEAWGKDQKWNTSLCHAWAAAPIPVLMEYFRC